MSGQQKFKRSLITAALPYANGPLHIGHLAGAYLPADIYARFQRLRNEDVLFVCGSDEHGTAITLKAREMKINPAVLVEKYHHQFKDVFQKLNISFDYYHRTSSKLHHQTASTFFKKLHDDGCLFEQESEQFFDTKEQIFLADRYIYGTCPQCGADGAYGDQCEKCGSGLSPKELIEPRSTLSHEKPELRKTTHWYFPLNEYEDWLKDWILNKKQKTWKPNVTGQCKSWLDQSLKPRSFTRDLEWGVPVPVEGAEGKVLYVWVDAPVGYISATKAWAQKRAESYPDKYSAEDWRKYWQSNETRLIHFIGKDNIFFHCIMFPAMLKATGENTLPDNVPANEFMNLEGQKISTSRNWAIWLHEFIEDMPDKTDVLRYALTVHAPETSDSDFSWNDFRDRNNNELVGIFGNFINRVIVLINKHFDGKVPELSDNDFALQLVPELEKSYNNIEESFSRFRLREALNGVMDIARTGNRFLNETEPWSLVKTDKEKAGAVLNAGAQIAAHLTMASEPFLPETAEQLRKMLNIKPIKWEDRFEFAQINAGHELSGEKGHLFQKIDENLINKQKDKLKANLKQKVSSEKKPAKEPIEFDDFNKLELITATIKEAETVPKAKKLLKLKIDTGSEERTVVAGIAQDYSPEEVAGKQVCFLANIKPKKIKGIESHGMVLMAEDDDGNLQFVSPETAVKNGNTIR